jgi:urea transport system ATP-binding protein
MLKLWNVSAGYGSLVMVERLSFEVKANERLVILGPNGAGKTTVLKAIVGLIRVSSGTIELGGRTVCNRPVHRNARDGVVYTAQARKVFDHLTVDDNLKLFAAGAATPATQRWRDEVLGVFPVLEKRLAIPAGTLSGGEKQQLSLSRLWLNHCRLWLLDEPSMALGTEVLAKIRKRLEANIKGSLIPPTVIAEQNITFALSVADRVCVVRGGRITHTSDRGQTSEEHVRTILGQPGM